MRECRAVVEVDKLTRRVNRRFKSASECAQATGIPWSSLIERLRRKGLGDGRFYYRYVEEFDPAERFEGQRGCPVMAVNERGEAIEAWPDSAIAAAEIGVTRRQLCQGIARGRVFNFEARGYTCRLAWMEEWLS